MARLKRALRARLLRGPADAASIAAMAAAIEAAAESVESEMTGNPAPTELVRSTAVVKTPKAAGYLAQLCKHFAHKIPASFEGNRGRSALRAGSAG